MKKTLLVLAMVLLVACFSVFAFAACNNTDNNTITMVVGSNPIRSTKTGNRRSENCGDFSFDHRNTTDGFLF